MADRASPGDVLATEDALPEIVPDDVSFELVERASLKGVSTPVTLYRVHRGSVGH